MVRRGYTKHRRKLLAALVEIRAQLEAAYAILDYELIASAGDHLWQTQEILAKLRRDRFKPMPKKKKIVPKAVDRQVRKKDVLKPGKKK